MCFFLLWEEEKGLGGIGEGRVAMFHVTRQLENQNKGSSFAPPRWGHVAKPWWIGVRQATPQRFMIKAYYVGKLTLIADLDHWNQLICQCWIESMVNSVCHSDRSDREKPSLREGLNEGLAPSSVWRWLKVTTLDWQLIQEKEETWEKWDLRSKNQKLQSLIWVIAQKFGSQKTCTSGCFSNAKMVSFMPPCWENLSKWMWNIALIKSESWQTWLNRKICCSSTVGEWSP